jgi:YD repeat-containing protein
MMTKRTMHTVTCVFVFALQMSTYSQNEELLPKVTPVSPEVASLGKYIEMPVSYFNGLPEISIPVYQIISGAIRIPISLTYHSSGIKVSEEASWVGLGWNLSAGGMITHISKGIDDNEGQGTTHILNRCFPMNNGHEYDEYCKEINSKGCNSYNIDGEIEDFSAEFNSTKLDGEADLYSYGFNGYSGKFLYVNNKVFNISRDDILFDVDPENIVAITPDGFTYTFSVTEKSYTMTGSGSAGGFKSVNAYYLTKIESPQGDQINLFYKSFKQIFDDEYAGNGYAFFDHLNFGDQYYVPQMPNLSEYVVDTDDGSAGGYNCSISTTFIDVKYLDRIEWQNYVMQFKPGSREDNYGFRLNNILISRIDNEDELKHFKFNYDYFIGQKVYGGDYLNNHPNLGTSFIYNISEGGYPENYRKKRLRLLSFEEVGTSENVTHTFEYNTTELPYKSSYAQDYWGFYNGENAGVKTIVPDFRRYMYQMEIPLGLSHYIGANREPSLINSQAGILTRIVYPTGGWTDFEYELNSYTNLTWQQGIKRVTQTIEARDEGEEGAVESDEFTISQGVDVELLVQLYCCVYYGSDPLNDNCWKVDNEIRWDCGEGMNVNSLYAVLYKKNGSSWVNLHTWDISDPEIRSANDGSPQSHHDLTYYLAPGTYKIETNFPDNKIRESEAQYALIRIRYDKKINSSNESNTGGGLRIKTILQHDDYNPDIVKNYEYSDGVMMKFPIFYWYNQILKESTVPDSYNIYKYHYLYANPIVPYSFAANGSLVGYRNIKENIIGKGKTEYIYQVREDKLEFNVDPADYAHKYITGVPSTSFLDNGMLKEMNIYEVGATFPIKKVINEYQVLKPEIFWNFKTNIKNPNPLSSEEFCDWLGQTYYPIPMGKVVTSSKVERNYISVENYMEKKQNYFYESSYHLYPTRTTEKTSDEAEITTNYLYPQDYEIITGIPTYLSEMISNHIIDKPVEIYVRKGDIMISGNYSSYRSGTDIGLKDKSYILEIENELKLSINFFPSNYNGSFDLRSYYVPFVNYDKYDASKILQWHKENDVINTFVWGYGNSLPVLKVKGLTYDQLESEYAAIIPYIRNDNNLPQTSDLNSVRTKLSSIKGSLSTLLNDSRYQVTLYTYAPLIGLTSITGPDGYTSYYVYDDLGRLVKVMDDDGNILKEYNYHFKGQ